jgi:exosortase/archaeosortase family protein
VVALGSTIVWLPYILQAPFNLFQTSAYYQEGGLFPWIILFSILVWLFIKRRQLLSKLDATEYIPEKTSLLLLGVLVCLSAVMITPLVDSSLPRRLFPASLFSAGVFLIFGAVTPLILSFVYGVGVFLPSLVKEFVEVPYSSASAQIVASLLKFIGYPVRSEGIELSFSTISGRPLQLYVDSICAGASSLTVFAALFVLVTLDLGLKPNWGVAGFFAAGSIGTYLQAVLRLITIVLTGFYLGEEAMWQTHVYAGYIIFLLYFTLFTILYLRWTKKQTKYLTGKVER